MRSRPPTRSSQLLVWGAPSSGLILGTFSGWFRLPDDVAGLKRLVSWWRAVEAEAWYDDGEG